MCLYCKKDPRPPAETQKPQEREGESIQYRIRFKPNEDPSREAKTKERAKNAREIIQALTQGPDGAREYALDELFSNNLDINDELIAALEDQRLIAREYIAKALGRTRSHKAVDALIRILDGSNLALRLSAAWALYRIGNDKAVTALKNRAGDKEAPLRHYLGYLLGDLEGGQEQLIKMTGDPDPKVRGQAILSLSHWESGKALEAAQRAKKDPDPTVRNIAAGAAWRLTQQTRKTKKQIGIIALAVAAMAALGFFLYRFWG